MEIEQPQRSFGDKALLVGYKVGGWHLRFKSIGLFITGIVLIAAGIIFSYISYSNGNPLKNSAYLLLVLILFGLLAMLGGWFYWRRARSLVRGRFY
jgi:uncharacterized membrane protein YidH (DUF202 family)